MISIHPYKESWPIRGNFNIARGSKNTAEVLVVEIHENGKLIGRGEGVPYARYGESMAQCISQIKQIGTQISTEPNRQKLLDLLPAGAARNALDCALWDFEAKKSQRPVWQIAGLSAPPKSLKTAYTIGLDEPEIMAAKVKDLKAWDLFKLKLKDATDLNRVQAVREAAPAARIIVDANEAWDYQQLVSLLPKLAQLGVELIEQPLPATQDHNLQDCERSVPICADESCHTLEDLGKCAGKYDYVNIKLDKTGGLTHALEMLQEAKSSKLQIMLGCMVCTSLSIAPALLLAGQAQVIDLDGPLLLEKDRTDGVKQENQQMLLPAASFWGNP